MGITNSNIITLSIPILKELAINDENNLVSAAAISLLGRLKQRENITLFKQTLRTASYAVNLMI